MTERSPLSASEAGALAEANGLRAPAELAAGVANRLNAAAAEADRWRGQVGREVQPFVDFDLGPPPPLALSGTRPAGGARTAGDDGDLLDTARRIRERSLGPIELTARYLDDIARVNPGLVAYLTVASERAIEDAERAEHELDAGVYRGPMHGVPIAHKDLIPTRGIRTTYHTDAFKENVPDEDAPVVTRLAAAGSVLLGKANTLELGSGDGDVFGLARNPWDPERQVGGSSSGSAVAVAAGLAAAATGTDAGGSIRIPAAFCGIVGVKPTAGLVATSPGSNGLSVTGPMTRTTLDAALMLEAMTGASFLGRVTGDVAGMTFGLPVDWLDTPIEDEIAASLNGVVELLRGLGATVREVRLPHAAASEVLGGVITHVDLFGKYRFLLEQGAKLGRFVHELLLAAELYPASAYRLAQRLRRLMLEDVKRAHESVDVLLTPIVPFRAARLTDTELRVGDAVVSPRSGQGRFTRLSNLTGHPSMSVPTGLDSNGMPVAVQLQARPYQEALMLSAARAIELHNPQRAARPRLHA